MASVRFACLLLIGSAQVFSTEAQCTDSTDLMADGTMKMITSPNYPDMYPKDITCGFNITASPGQRVHVESVDVHLYGDTTDCGDKIEFFNGQDASSPVEKTVCGMEMVIFQSSGQYLFIRFKSDMHREGKGFALKYWSAPNYTDTCGAPLNVQTTPLFLNFPMKDCEYNLEAGNNQMIFVDLMKWKMPESISCDDGSLKIYNGPSSANDTIINHCGPERPFSHVSSSGKSLKIMLNMNVDVASREVYMKIKAMNTIVTSCDMVSSMPVGPMPAFIYYPLFKTSSVSCPKTLLAPGTTVRVAVMEQNCDAMLPFTMSEEGQNKAFSCMNGHRVYSSMAKDLQLNPTNENPVLLKVSSFGSYCGKDATPMDLSPPSNTSVMEMELEDIQRDSYCKKRIRAGSDKERVELVLTSTLMDNNDCVMVENAMSRTGEMKMKYCGKFGPMTFTSKGQELSFTVMTDDKNSKGKIKVQYYSLLDSLLCKRYENLLATRQKKTLMTPNFPYEYPLNALCSWRFASYRSDYVVVIEVEEADLPSHCQDLAFVNDGELETNDRLGEFCGTRKPTYRGTGQTLLVTFNADHMKTGHKGFKFTYYADNKVPREMVAGTDVATIAAVFTIIIVAGGLIFIVYRLCSMRKQKMKAREADRQPITQ